MFLNKPTPVHIIIYYAIDALAKKNTIIKIHIFIVWITKILYLKFLNKHVEMYYKKHYNLYFFIVLMYGTFCNLLYKLKHFWIWIFFNNLFWLTIPNLTFYCLFLGNRDLYFSLFISQINLRSTLIVCLHLFILSSFPFIDVICLYRKPSNFTMITKT